MATGKRTKPVREQSKVTIANLEREVRILTERCGDLVKSRDSESSRRLDTMIERDKLGNKTLLLEGRIRVLETENAEIQWARGYIERVKEEDKNRYGEIEE